jgi:RNA polymerase sigma-70 factor (ECF subfamily)
MKDFSAAVLSHADTLASYARKLTQNGEAAKDLFQDTLFKALANSSTFHRGSDLKPWLYTIMRNQFFNLYRKNKWEKKLLGRGSPVAVNPVDTSTYAFTTTHLEVKQVKALINEMPASLRVPIQLYCQGYKYQEIAALTGTPVGTTKSRIHMARQLLRKKI